MTDGLFRSIISRC